ncbi:MAG TPA: hypothetical protein VMV94_11755 [Phycisphaerae bacterium]|nr:hypothetical protein [Phycisphaerae bacterium]
MSTLLQRLGNVRRAVRVGCILGLAGMVAVAVVGVILFAGQSEYGSQRFLLGIVAFATALVAGAFFVLLWGLLDVLLKLEANTFRMYDVLRDLQNGSQGNLEHLRVIAENAQLSDAARSITHRERERTALRLAINEEIIRGDWEAAYALVELLEARHGYKNEAMRLRQELDQSRDRDQNQELYDRIERTRSLMTSRDWDRARHEMEALLTEHPQHEQVRELPKLFAKCRNDHKRQLLKEWDDSVQRNEIDRGIALLKELDQYLTRNEAAALEESARGVFRAKLHNLGVQFSLAVADHNWKQALEVGCQIVEEFPNSRMAQEVHDHMEVLHKRAAEAEDAEQAQPSSPSTAAAPQS